MLNKAILITLVASMVFGIISLSLEISDWVKNTAVAVFLSATGLHTGLYFRGEFPGKSKGKKEKQPPTI